MERHLVKLYPYKETSKGARLLSESLGIKRIRREGSNFVGGRRYTVINWGNSELPDEIIKCNVINDNIQVNRCINKLSFLRILKESGVRCPDFTTDVEEALSWVSQGSLVFARTKLTTHSGVDIVMIDKLEEFVEAPLFTRYVPKKEEYRIHFAFGEQIDAQRKVLRQFDDNGTPIDPKSVDFRIRNWSNGFIFQRDGINPPKDVLEQAEGAFRASKLDFGALDVIFNKKQGKAYVLEINTSPGIEGTTVDNYTEAFSTHFRLE